MWDIAFLEQIPLHLAWKSLEESAIELEKTAEKLRNKCKTNPILLKVVKFPTFLGEGTTGE